MGTTRWLRRLGEPNTRGAERDPDTIDWIEAQEAEDFAQECFEWDAQTQARWVAEYP